MTDTTNALPTEPDGSPQPYEDGRIYETGCDATEANIPTELEQLKAAYAEAVQADRAAYVNYLRKRRDMEGAEHALLAHCRGEGDIHTARHAYLQQAHARQYPYGGLGSYLGPQANAGVASPADDIIKGLDADIEEDEAPIAAITPENGRAHSA